MSSLPSLTFASLLRRHRRAAGLTQEALAEQARLSVKAISALERGDRRTPRQGTIDLLAEALGLSPAERTHLHQVARGQKPPASAGFHRLTIARKTLLPLAGRRQEVAQLARHLAGAGPPLLLLVVGEPGIGKSRLLAEAAERARAQGWTVLEGGCHRRSGQEPFTPLLTALEGTLRRTAPAALRSQLEGCSWLARLLPELAETTLVPAPAWSLSPEQERRLMFGAVARYLANVAGPAGTLLVLDDLQWAGVDALDLLATLLRTPGEQPLRVVGAYRSTEVHPPDPLGSLLADLGAGGLADEIRLGPLAPEEAAGLLQSMLEGHKGTGDALRVQALFGIRRQHWEEAQAALEEALALCRTMPYPYAEAKALYVYGLLHQAKGETAQARARLKAALTMLSRLGERLYAEQVERALAKGRRP